MIGIHIISKDYRNNVNETENKINSVLEKIRELLESIAFAEETGKLIDVYSHELFHAYHYVHMNDQTKWAYDNKSRIVKESRNK